MLKIKNITKIYETGDFKQTALDNVSISFRKSEFASILGPSGSGKTTLLNIIGGLDKYTSGDLIINNVSTRLYKESDWDSYRNHRIGFVFQSYNLISHQTVLQNVMLALTLSGISKKEGIEKAKKVLCDVGLKDHINKMPNQLSGGQMQRVAIARALVNDPDILLADEPTGALDSETSIQIMELLKKIAKTKLVVMVTHNPDLAKEYSSRIINLSDGKIISDSNPFDEKKQTSVSSYEKTKKTFMSFWTALNLSFNNLMTKKGRTLLVSFASSIGIIGIALIMSLSNGFQNYIDKLQEDTLSSYPLTITSETMDMTSMLLSMSGKDKDIEKEDGFVNEHQVVSSMFSSITTNDLKSFKQYIDKNYNKISKNVTTIKYTYSIDPIIYTKDVNKKISRVNPNTLFSSMYASNSLTNSFSSYSSIFSQMLDNKDILESQYDVLSGRWPNKYDEMIVVLTNPDSITDLMCYFLGLRDIDELYDIISKSMSGETIEIQSDPLKLSYEDLMNIELKLFDPTKLYKYNPKYEIYEDMSEDEDYIKKIYNESLNLKIVGVVAPKDGVNSMALNPGIVYTSDLIKHLVDEVSKSDIVKKQLENRNVDVFSNTDFDAKNNDKKIDFDDMISIDKKMLESAFGGNVSENDIKNMTTNYMNQISKSISTDTKPAIQDFSNTLSDLSTLLLKDYVENPESSIPNPLVPGSQIALMSLNSVPDLVENFIKREDVREILGNLEKKYVIPASVFGDTYKSLICGMLQGYINVFYSTNPSVTVDSNNPTAIIAEEAIDSTVNEFMSQALVVGTADVMGQKMTEAVMQKSILTSVGNLTQNLITTMSSAFKVDPDKIAKAFKFNMNDDELRRLMSAMMSSNEKSNAKANLISLGYQDLEEPTTMSFYFNSFDGKESFIDFIDSYNKKVISQNEDNKEINYSDITGILMSSVKKIVNSVSYVLIAFVSISLIVSSIMIGIITYISVLERTKEIGILRAIGASKKNVSSIFNAETFIIGFLSGAIGIGITLLLIPVINSIIYSLTENANLTASMPLVGIIGLIILSVILTIIGGFIPSKSAAKKDVVIALRTE